MPVETSIIVRTLNEAKHLENLMKGIHAQNYHDWEIVLVDSGSTDGSPDIARRYGARIFHIPKNEFTYGRSLNLGCQQALGRYLVFASGHVWPITNNWLGSLIKPFEEPSVAMVYGRQRGTGANRLSEIRDLHSQFGSTSQILVDEPKGNNGNAAVRQDLWIDQPFDESLPGLEDLDWARKAERKNYRVYYSADAAVYHVHEESLPQVYRRHLREAIAAKRMFPGHRFTGRDFAKGLPYFIARDILYAFRHGMHRKLFQIPATRLAQFWGIYRGVQYHQRLGRDLVRRLNIPETSSSVVIDGPGRHSLQQRAITKLNPDEVLVQIAYVGVGRLDQSLANGEGNDGAQAQTPYPKVPGHEFSGIVVNSGGRSRIPTGQRVVGRYIAGCGLCPGCSSGDRDQCSQSHLNGGSGAYASFVAIPSSQVHRIPPSMPLKHGALIRTIAISLAGLTRLAVEPGRQACVIGAGPLGNLCAQILRNLGVRTTVVDPESRWLSLLYKYDVDTLTELGDLSLYDYLIETRGSEEILPYLGENSKPSAKLLLLAPPPSALSNASNGPTTGSGNVVRTYGASHPRVWKEATRLVSAKAINLDDHTSVVEPLDAYDRVWKSLEAREQFKVLLSANRELEAL